MPTYPVKNLKTGEEKELHMTMKEYMAWKKIILTGIKTGQKDVLAQVKLVIGAQNGKDPSWMGRHHEEQGDP